MSQCSLTFPPFKKLSVHVHYETKLDQEIVYLIISGVSSLLISGEESKQTENIFKKSYCWPESCKHIALLREHREREREEATVNMVNVNCSIASFMALFSHSNCLELLVKEKAEIVCLIAVIEYIYITDIIYTAYTCNTGEDITCK